MKQTVAIEARKQLIVAEKSRRCPANDSSHEDIFVEQLTNNLTHGDVVVGISGSGNSANVLKAIAYANRSGAESISLSGFDVGNLAKLAKIGHTVPNHCMQQVEDIHVVIEHLLPTIPRDSPECAGKQTDWLKVPCLG